MSKVSVRDVRNVRGQYPTCPAGQNDYVRPNVRMSECPAGQNDYVRPNVRMSEMSDPSIIMSPTTTMPQADFCYAVLTDWVW